MLVELLGGITVEGTAVPVVVGAGVVDVEVPEVPAGG
jgi:hypothetical protein